MDEHVVVAQLRHVGAKVVVVEALSEAFFLGSTRTSASSLKRARRS